MIGNATIANAPPGAQPGAPPHHAPGPAMLGADDEGGLSELTARLQVSRPHGENQSEIDVSAESLLLALRAAIDDARRSAHRTPPQGVMAPQPEPGASRPERAARTGPAAARR
jgi:hypothetical protein